MKIVEANKVKLIGEHVLVFDDKQEAERVVRFIKENLLIEDEFNEKLEDLYDG